MNSSSSSSSHSAGTVIDLTGPDDASNPAVEFLANVQIQNLMEMAFRGKLLTDMSKSELENACWNLSSGRGGKTKEDLCKVLYNYFNVPLEGRDTYKIIRPRLDKQNKKAAAEAATRVTTAVQPNSINQMKETQEAKAAFPPEFSVDETGKKNSNLIKTYMPHEQKKMKVEESVTSKKRSFQGPVEFECPICLVTKPPVALKCGHVFCKDCAHNMRKHCAFCRKHFSRKDMISLFLC
jgi:hypothetical protein